MYIVVLYITTGTYTYIHTYIELIDDVAGYYNVGM